MLKNCLSGELSGGLDCSSLPGVKTRGWSILQYYQGIGQLVGFCCVFFLISQLAVGSQGDLTWAAPWSLALQTALT